MSSGSVLQVMAPVGLSAVVATTLAVVVNLATGGGPLWMWVLVVLLTGAGTATSIWLHLHQSSAAQPASGGAHAPGLRSVAIHGNPAGPISTGDVGTPAGPAQPSPAGMGGGTTNVPRHGASATGERSVAIDGNPGGEISTGDHQAPPRHD